MVATQVKKLNGEVSRLKEEVKKYKEEVGCFSNKLSVYKKHVARVEELEQYLVEIQVKLESNIKAFEKYLVKQLHLKGKEKSLLEEVERWRSECNPKDVTAIDDHAKGFNKALAHVVALCPDFDLSDITVKLNFYAKDFYT